MAAPSLHTENVNVHHRRALAVLGGTFVLDIALGAGYALASHISVGHGIYCATGIATTVGCDVTPHGWLPYLLCSLMMVTIVPLFASVFSLFTTGLMADHMKEKNRASGSAAPE